MTTRLSLTMVKASVDFAERRSASSYPSCSLVVTRSENLGFEMAMASVHVASFLLSVKGIEEATSSYRQQV